MPTEFFGERVFNTLNVEYATEFDDKNDIHIADNAKDMIKMLAKSLDQVQIENLSQIKNLSEKFYKVMQDMPHLCLFVNSPPSE